MPHDLPRVINPLGFTLEKLRRLGKFRDKDHDKPM